MFLLIATSNVCAFTPCNKRMHEEKKYNNLLHRQDYQLLLGPGRGGVLPYMGYIGMCGPKGYGFSAVLAINRVTTTTSPLFCLVHR